MHDRPLIFLGTNSAMQIYLETCAENKIPVHGIIDQDYYGNTDKLWKVPVIDTQQCFQDPDRARYYRDNFVFFCATNWMPMADKPTTRNRQKRHELLQIIDQNNLKCANIIDQRSKVSPSAQLGQGVFVAEWVVVEPDVVIEDHVCVWSHSVVGHDSRVGRNSVIQRHCTIVSHVTMEENVYLGMSVRLYKSYATLKKNTFVHECVYLKRSTLPNEIIGLHSQNPRRVTVLDRNTVD
jgi:acetyltransferase-like isoleucine patch superfamily enzyme